MNKFASIKSRFAVSLLSALPFVALAEGESGGSTPASILTSVQTALETLLSTAIPIVSTIIIAGVTLWGAMKLVRLVMKAFGFGTR